VNAFNYRSLLLVAVAGGSALSLSLARAQTPPAAGGGPARKPPEIADFSASNGHWLWLKRVGDAVELVRGGPGERPTAVARGRDWVEVGQNAGGIWMLSRTGDKGELLHTTGSAAPASAVSDLSRPAGLLAVEGRVFWMESVPSPEKDESFIAAASATCRLKVREASGQVRTLDEWPTGHDAGQGDVVGVSGDSVIVRLHRPYSTEFLRVPLGGGPSVRIAAEEGWQKAQIIKDSLYWTAPSEEANQRAGICCVRRGRGAAEPETISDWLPMYGILHASGARLYYLPNGMDHNLYQVPDRLELPIRLRSLPGPATMDGDQPVLLTGPNAPALAPPSSH
jgi:hypothetical protein